MTEYRHQPLSARIDFSLLKSDVVLFILCKEGHIELPLRNKQNQKLRKMFSVTDGSLPVLRFVVPSHISCGEMRKTCCISLCVYARDLPFGQHLDQCHGATYCAWTNQRGLPNLALMTTV